MPAALNIRPQKRDEVKALAIHSFRRGEPAESVNPSLSHLNRTLYGHSGVAGALGALPTRQPDGRKIRKDANLGASFVLTLPQELTDQGEDALAAWQEASMQWINDEAPGKMAYAVLHMDEPGARPHIHVMMLPVDETGRYDYKGLYDSNNLFAGLQNSYTDALRPLGVEPNTPEVSAALKPTYTPFANPGGAQISAILRQAPDATTKLTARATENIKRKEQVSQASDQVHQRAESMSRQAETLDQRESLLARWREELGLWRDSALAAIRRQLQKLALSAAGADQARASAQASIDGAANKDRPEPTSPTPGGP